jgi:LysR family nitrogen assimilation transcriptional regulator
MKLNDLKLYIEVVEAGGMTQAASKLGMSQPGLSRTIRDLELKLDARLLERTGRGVELTNAGYIFLEYCRQTIALYERTHRRIRRETKSMPGSLNIAIPLRVSSMLTPALLRAFQKQLPQVSVHIYEAISEQIVLDISDSKRDLGLVYQPPVNTSPMPQALASENLYLVGCADLIRGTSKPVKLAEIASMPMLLPSRESHYRRLIEASFQKAGAKPNVVRELEIVDALLAFAMEAEGVTILAYSNVWQEVERGDIHARKIISPKINRTISLVLGRHIDHFAATRIKKIVNQAITTVSNTCRWKLL